MAAGLPLQGQDVQLMFSPVNLTDEIERVIPALHQPLHTEACEKSLYKKVGVLSRYVAEKACSNELPAVKRAFYLVDELYQEGNGAVRAAIENVFVFSLSTTLYRLGSGRKRVLALIPVTLFTLYMKQVLRKGC